MRARRWPLRAPRSSRPEDIAVGVGAPKSVNVVLLGALATRLDFSQEAWERVVARRVPPKTVDANLAAFRAGLAFAREAAGGEGA